MGDVNDRLTKIAASVKKGNASESVTCREFVGWFGASRRKNRVVSGIREALEKAKLITEPDFETVNIDTRITFKACSDGDGSAAKGLNCLVRSFVSDSRRPVTVSPNDSVQKAISQMLINNYSQLPVLTTETELKGIVSWRSILHAKTLGKECSTVGECMQTPAMVVSEDTNLFEAAAVVLEHEYVLVRGVNKKISGIVTAADLGYQFRELAEPFVLIGDIESSVRRLIHGRFQTDELQKIKNPADDVRTVDGVDDLTFGEYIRLIEGEDNWAKLKINLDRKVFVERLKDVCAIRNDVMHFDPDGLEPDSLLLLRQFSNVLRQIG